MPKDDKTTTLKAVSKKSGAKNLFEIMEENAAGARGQHSAPKAEQPRPASLELNGDLHFEWLDRDVLEKNPYQPRMFRPVRHIERLKKSFNENGQLQAALVRPHPTRKGRFQIGDGSCRDDAVEGGANAGSQQNDPHLYIGKLACVVRNITDEEMLEFAYETNELREDFAAVDRANYFQTKKDNSKLTWGEIAATKAMTERSVLRLVALLKLPESVQRRLSEIDLAVREDGDEEPKPIRPGEKHGRALLLLQPAEQRDPKKHMNARQRQLLDAIEEEKLSGNAAIRRAEALLPPSEKALQRAAAKAAADAQKKLEQQQQGKLFDGVAATPTGTPVPAASGAGAALGSGITISRSTVGFVSPAFPQGVPGDTGFGETIDELLASLVEAQMSTSYAASIVDIVGKTLEGGATANEAVRAIEERINQLQRTTAQLATNCEFVKIALGIVPRETSTGGADDD